MVNRLPVRNEYGYQWMVAGPNHFQICGRTTETLPPGAYNGWLDNCGNVHFQARDLHVDELINFPDSLPALRSVQGATTDAQRTADSAASKASSARMFAVVALALAAGAIGLSAGLSMRRRSS